MKTVGDDRDGARHVSEDDFDDRDGEIEKENAVKDADDLRVPISQCTLQERNASTVCISQLGILNVLGSEDVCGRYRPPPELYLPDDVLLRDEAPVPAVGAVVPMIPHHEVVALRND